MKKKEEKKNRRLLRGGCSHQHQGRGETAGIMAHTLSLPLRRPGPVAICVCEERGSALERQLRLIPGRYQMRRGQRRQGVGIQGRNLQHEEETRAVFDSMIMFLEGLGLVDVLVTPDGTHTAAYSCWT